MILARLCLLFERSGNDAFNPFLLDIGKLPPSLEILELTGIPQYRCSDIKRRLHVSGEFKCLKSLREVRSEHQAVLKHIKEEGKPCNTHLKFVRLKPTETD